MYERSKIMPTGTIKYDIVYLVEFLAVLLQLGIAVILLGLLGDWAVLVIVIAGTILSFATGLLPQYRTEK